MRVFSIDEVIGEFEACAIEEEKIKSMRLTAQASKKALTDRFKAFAKDLETKPKQVKMAYNYWKEKQQATNKENTGDAYEIMAMLDAAAEAEENKD